MINEMIKHSSIGLIFFRMGNEVMKAGLTEKIHRNKNDVQIYSRTFLTNVSIKLSIFCTL